jgi:MATE family multidrug resistance protein
VVVLPPLPLSLFLSASKVLTQSILFSCLSVPIILALIPAGRWVLATAGLSEVEVVQAKTYLTILMAGTALDLVRHSLNSYFGGLGKTKVILLSTFVMAIASVGANYVLIFGKLGFPELGIAGAGYETVFAWFTGALTLAIIYFQQVRFPEYQLLQSFQLDLGILKKLVRYGFASGLEITLPIFAIDLLILAFQSYGIIVSTAITVAFTWIHTLFIPVIGLEIGTMSLTGRFVGARDPDAASDSVFSGLFLASIYAFVVSLTCLLMTPMMIGIFLEPDSLTETLDLAKWGTQLNAFMMFILGPVINLAK